MIDTISPTQTQLEKITKFNACINTAMELVGSLPDSMDAAQAFIKLKEAGQWFASSVFLTEKEIPEDKRPRIMIQ